MDLVQGKDATLTNRRYKAAVTVTCHANCLSPDSATSTRQSSL